MRIELETATSRDALAWGFETFGDRIALSTAFGPSGVVLMHLASQVCPGAKVFFIDTGFHFPETLRMVDRIQDRLNVCVEVIEPSISLGEQASLYGSDLNIVDPDRCCALRKVEPTRRMLDGLDAWITALRRDQGPSRAHLRVLETKEVEGRFLAKLNPLVRWTKAEIWQHVVEHGLPYNPLHDAGYPSIGCQPCTNPATDPNDERSGRWAGKKKSECGLHTLI